jgi:hypothetical protein
MEEQREQRHTYDYNADCRKWEREHGTKTFVLNPTPLPGWMKHRGKNYEDND